MEDWHLLGHFNLRLKRDQDAQVAVDDPLELTNEDKRISLRHSNG